MTRACLFPLRTNAGFYRDRGMLKLRERVREAALLYDQVILEDGIYTATVGLTTSVEFHEPATEERLRRCRVLKSRGGRFSLALRHDETGARGVLAADEPVQRRFVAENRTIIKEFVQEAGADKLPDWIVLGAFDLPHHLVRQIKRMARQDAVRPGMWRRRQDHRLRDRVLESLEHDLVLGALLGCLVSMDGYFGPLAGRKPEVAQGTGHVALRILVPNFGSLSWTHIMELREHPGIESFRSKLTEIEEEAADELERAASEGREAVLRRAMIDLAQKWRPPSFVDTAGKVVMDLFLGSIPGVGVAASAIFEVGDAAQEARTWGAVFLRLQELT